MLLLIIYPSARSLGGLFEDAGPWRSVTGFWSMVLVLCLMVTAMLRVTAGLGGEAAEVKLQGHRLWAVPSLLLDF